MPTKDTELIVRLRQTREALQLTQTQLAKKAGINDKQISHYETGVAKPSLGNLIKLAKALEVEFTWLAGIKE